MIRFDSPSLDHLLKLLGVATLYAILAKLVLQFFSANGVISIVWPPSGLALAVLLIGGNRYLPGVFLGAILASAATGLTLGEAGAIAVGNTVEGYLGAWLLTRKNNFDPDLPSLRHYLRLVGLAGFIACGLAALNGSTILFLTGHLSSKLYSLKLLHWWMGDVLGIALITPFILVWRRLPASELEPQRLATFGLVLVLAVLAGQIVFLGWYGDVLGEIAQDYWMFLFVAWASVSLGSRGVVVLLIATACQALLGAVWHVGYFAHDISNSGLTNFWFYFMVLSFVGMTVSTYMTGRKAAEEAAAAAARYARSLIEASLDPLVTISAEGKITDVNAATETATGISRDRLVGTDFAGYFTDSDKAREGYQRVFSRGFVTDYPLAIRQSTGKIIDVLYNANLYRDVQGKVLGVFAAARDITAHKRAEAELERHRDALAQEVIEHARAEEEAHDAYRALKDTQARMIQMEKLSALGTLVGGVAHEINNPLMGIRGYIEYAIAKVEQDRARDMLERALGEVERIARIVKNMLVFSRFRLRAAGESCDPERVISTVLTLVAGEMHKLDIDIQVRIGPPKPHLRCDPDSLQQILLNLLLNARDTLRDAPPPRRVVITLTSMAMNRAVLRVADNGPGIPENIKTKVFDPFFTTKPAGSGTGLGLAVSRQLVEAAGGQMTVADSPDGGAEFSIELDQFIEVPYDKKTNSHHR